MDNTRLGIRAATATVVAVAAMSAFLLYTPTSSGYTFATGTFTLTIDSHAIYNGIVQLGSTWELKKLVPGADKFFNIEDVKPGDRGEATISFHVNQDAWLCLDFQNLQSNDNTVNEPEALADANGVVSGELANGMEFFAWYDDGDDIFEIGEEPIFGTTTQSASIVLNGKTYPIADALHGPAIPANVTKHIGILWCAGNLTVNVAAATTTCDGTAMGNEAQTDSMSVDVSFSSIPKSDDLSFTCNGGGGGGGGGMGDEIGLFVKCQLLAPQGWPLPTYSIECPDGFVFQEPDTSGRTERTNSTRTSR